MMFSGRRISILLYFVLLSATTIQRGECFCSLSINLQSASQSKACRRPLSLLCMAKTPTALRRMEQSWFPRKYDDDDIYNSRATEDLEEASLNFLATLIRKHLSRTEENTTNTGPTATIDADLSTPHSLAAGRFADLTCTQEGERILERLFLTQDLVDVEEDILLGAVTALQSLCIMGTQVGVKGTPEQLQRMVAHLEPEQGDPADTSNAWNANNVRNLKYSVDQIAGTQLLAVLKRKRTTMGAFGLLVDMGVWERHENLALLRSGFPIRFTTDEKEAARHAESSMHDPDQLLGLRKDFRDQKVYTIDSASTNEIDDGLSVEVLENDDGTTRHRFWIHIADADRWAPRDSQVFGAAARRASSLYLPTGSIPMFPKELSTGVMSLKAHQDTCALSLGVELHPDGSIDASSLIVTPSRIRVQYRLSFDEVDEMLEEGVAYLEEWELGTLLAVAIKRREYRMGNGSSEAMVPHPIPQASIATYRDESAPDGLGIKLTVEVSHNAGQNQTANAEGAASKSSSSESTNIAPVSPSFMLVTEMMILAGEAIGKWKIENDREHETLNKESAKDRSLLSNFLSLPFRSQPKPDFQSRGRERRIWEDLLEHNVGNGYCHAWYSRRFFQPVKVSETVAPHSGLGLDCYVQWSSPIRRFGDLQCHAAVKRYIRRGRVNELVRDGTPLPSGLRVEDLGCALPQVNMSETSEEEKRDANVDDIDYRLGGGLIGAARQLQRASLQYWMFVYVQRLWDKDPDKAVFDCIVLGCVDPDRYQYVVYVTELGLEHRYLSQRGPLKAGAAIRLKVASVVPRTGLLTFTLAPIS